MTTLKRLLLSNDLNHGLADEVSSQVIVRVWELSIELDDSCKSSLWEHSRGILSLEGQQTPGNVYRFFRVAVSGSISCSCWWSCSLISKYQILRGLLRSCSSCIQGFCFSKVAQEKQFPLFVS